MEPNGKWNYQQTLFTTEMKHFHMQTLFGITSTGLNDAGEQHIDVANTYYMDSSEQYITQNVEQ